MSIADSLTATTNAPPKPSPNAKSAATRHAGDALQIRDVVQSVQNKSSLVWPLRDYIAVNPYAGMSAQKFLEARQSLQAVSDLETLMPVNYYREQFAQGQILKADVDAAVDELVADGVIGAERIDVNQAVALLCEQGLGSPTSDAEFAKPTNSARKIRTIAELLDGFDQSDWSDVILEEISKHCSAHYDQGQAVWSSVWQDLPLYQAWRSAAQHDCTFEIHGVSGFRKLVGSLPHDPHAAIAWLLSRLRVPPKLWEPVLLCHALTMPGWSAWAKYQHREAENEGVEVADFAGLLAMRLAYDAALSAHFAFEVSWHSMSDYADLSAEPFQASDEELLRYALLKASEIAYRRQLLADLAHNQQVAEQRSARAENGPSLPTTERGLAQMVFCIDVRSERIRRKLEAASQRIATFGFAGFFGLPIEYVPLGQTSGSNQVPFLLSPQLKVHEEICSCDQHHVEIAVEKRSSVRFLRKAWKDSLTSAHSSFAFVETTGLLYALRLVARTLGLSNFKTSRLDGVADADQAQLGPSLRGLSQQGVTEAKQADMAESILRGIGIVDDFARLVVLCGHGSQTENNPLQAGLDCGACGGHSGEANARFAAKLFNQPFVRQALVEHGIEIPQDCHFAAAVHNTTTDELEFFDLHEIPNSHLSDLQQLKDLAITASQGTRTERLPLLPGDDAEDLIRRSRDWSEVRPEWGLAGNAAFIAAPRSLTEHISLDGRSFLHSYDHQQDSQHAVLKQIMTAPLVVGHWINMQYYASTVDPNHFGSGNKTVHNVVGRFGILSGNGGDLMTGLPWQSVHDGDQLRHHPLRLLAVIAAPRDAIDQVVEEHSMIEQLLTNGWVQLIAVDGDSYYRYTERQTWDELQVDSAACCIN